MKLRVVVVALVLAAGACGESASGMSASTAGAPAAGTSSLGTGGVASPRGDAPIGGSSGERGASGPAAIAGQGNAGGIGGGGASGGGSGAGAAPSDAATAGASGQSGTSAGAVAGASAAGSAASGGAAGSAGTGGSNGDVDAAAMAKQMGFGTNIGNTLENTTSWETGWGQPLITQTFIQGIAKRGIKTVRVPVAWDTYATNGVIDAAKLARVKEVVGWIEAAGMYAIVNIHWDGGWIFNENKANAYTLTADVKAKFANYWKQIATGFRDVGHALILEGLNEEGRFYVNGDPNGTPDMAALNELNQLFVTTVRAQAGHNATRALLIAGFHTDIAKTCVDAFEVPADPAGPGKLFLSIHFYDPYTFTLMEDAASWGSPQATWGTDEEKKALEDLFSRLGAFSTRKMIPVILGEFAVTRGMKVVRESASRISWLESVATAAMSRGMVPILWDTGSEIARTDGSLSKELQTVMDHLQ